MKRTLLALALATSITPSFAATVLPDFTVDEGSVPGAAANIFDADKLNGGYNEIYSITAGGPTGLQFASNAYVNFSAFYANDAVDLVATQLGAGLFGATNQYQLYALFTASGTVTNAGGSAQFNGQAGSFSLFIDVNSNTTKALGATGSSAIILGDTVDDYLIASSTSLLSLANVIGNPGAFDLYFNHFELSIGDNNPTFAGDQNGENYFIQPNPFYLITNVDGDFDNIAFDDVGNAIATNGIYTTTVTGDVSAVFIPEPASLALMGIGLLGLGLSRRKQAQSLSA